MITFSIFANSAREKHNILDIVEAIPEASLSEEHIKIVLEKAKFEVTVSIIEEPVNLLEVSINNYQSTPLNVIQYHIAQWVAKCESCGARATSWSNYCGANVCGACGKHQKLARCFCGWNLQAGERLPDDIGEGKFDGKTWEVDY